MASTIRIAILANGTQAKREFKDVARTAEKESKRLNVAGSNFKAFGLNVAKVVAPVAAITSLIGPATTGLLAAAKGAVALGHGLAGLAPVVSFLPSLAGAAGILGGAAALALPGFAQGLHRIAAEFVGLDGKPTALQEEMKALAADGLDPLAKKFVKVNFPSIATAMAGIAVAMNKVVRGTLNWVNGVDGQELIRTISFGTLDAFNKLAPKIQTAAIALLDLGRRAGDPAIKGLGDVIGKILDKFTEWANSTSTQDIKDSLNDLKGFGVKLQDAFMFLRDVGRWMQDNQGQVKALSNVVAGLGLAFAIFTGGWAAAIIAAFSLIINNWGTVKAVFESAVTWWNGIWDRITHNANFQELGAAVVALIRAIIPPLQAGFKAIQDEVVPRLKSVKDVIVNEVVPALSGFIRAITPIVVMLVQVYGPVVARIFGGIVEVIKGALRIIAGVINVFTGLLTGNWSKVWQGIKQILGGAWDAIKGIIRAATAQMFVIFSAGVTRVVAYAQSIPGRIKGAIGNLGGLLASAGRAVVDGFLSGIRGAWGAVTGAVESLVSRIPLVVRKMLGIASPSKVLRALGRFTGKGFALGIDDSAKQVQAATNSLLAIPAAQSAELAMRQSVDLNTQAAALRSKADVTLSFDPSPTGDPLLDLFIEQLRKRVRISGGDVQAVLGR